MRHTVRFGRKGANGQQQLKEFDSAEGARSSFDKLIAEKLKKGYRETPGQETPGQSKIAATWSRIESWLEENAPASRAKSAAAGIRGTDRGHREAVERDCRTI